MQSFAERQSEQRAPPQVRPKFAIGEFCVWPEKVFAKRRTCADVLHDRGFAVSKATGGKG